MKIHLIPIIISVVVLVAYFSISPNPIQENSLSKQCDIPDDINFVERRRAISGPNDGKPHYSIGEEFSIFYTVPIGEFRVDDVTHSLILKPVPTSYGYIIMCDPLPVLEKRFEIKLHGLFVLVDGEEIEPNLVNDVLRIDINNNTRIEITDSSSKLKIENYASTLSEINQQGIIHQDKGDSEQLAQQMRLMQQKQKEIASKILELNINEAYVAEGWNFPFKESSKITIRIPEFKKPLCDIPEKIPFHLQMISQSEMFQMFAGKYSQDDLTIDISDERNHRGWIHYNLGATSDDGLFSAYTHFHFDSCTDETHGSYVLLCKDIKNDEHVSTRIKSEITSSLENKEFCNIELEPWHQDLRTYQTKISNELEIHSQKTILDSEENKSTRSHLEFKRLGLLLDITRHYDSSVLEPERLQDDLQEYDKVFGSLPDELLELIERENED